MIDLVAKVLFEKSSDAIYLVADEGLRIVEANEEACRLLGYSRDEFLKLRVPDLVPPDFRHRIEGVRDSVKSGSGYRRDRRMLLRKDGSAVATDHTLTRIEVSGQTCYVATVRDLTEREREAQELVEAKTFLEHVQENANDGFAVLDDHGVYVAVNRKLLEMNGARREDLIGRAWVERATPERLAGYQAFWDRLMRGETVRMRTTIERPDGQTIHVEVSSSPVDRAGRRYVFAIVRDITERVKAEEDLRRAHDRLAEANALLQAEIAERKRFEEDLVRATSELQSLFLVLPDLYFRMDQDERILAYRAPSPQELYLPPEKFLGRRMRDVLPPPAAGILSEAIARVLKTGEGATVEYVLPMPAGEQTYEARLLPFMDRQVIAIIRNTTESRRAEQRLASLAEEQSLLLAHTRDFLYRHDTKGIFTYVSPSVEQITGHTPAEWLRHYTDYLTENPINQRVIENTEETLRTGKQSPTYLVEIYAKDQRKVVLEVNERAYWENGKVAGIVGTARDVTERERAERRLIAQYAATKILAEAASLKEAAPRILQAICESLGWVVGGLWRVDPDAGVLRCVEFWHVPTVQVGGFIEISKGRTFAPGIGLPGRVWTSRAPAWIEDVVRDENFPRAPVAARDGLHGAFGSPILIGDRVLGVIEFFSPEIRRPDEDLLAMMGAVGSQLGQFIERQEAEDSLRFQKTLLESQSETSLDGILVFSTDGRMISFNRRFVEMWDIPEAVVRSRSDEAAIQSVLERLADPKQFLDRVRYLYEHPDEASHDEIVLKDGRTFDRYSAPIRNVELSYGRVCFFRDVTGRKRTEETLRRAAEETRRAYDDLKETQAQLIRTEKLASIGMLVSGVAHEINNPLNVMYGNLQLLAEVSEVLVPLAREGARRKKARGVEARLRKFRGMIRDALKAARHARGIVEDFRGFARDTRTAETVDLNRCLEAVLSLVQRELRSGIRIVLKLGKLPPVRCLRGQISQVFLNLLNNAVEAIEKKGTITLRTQRKDGAAVVEVCDTGRGMTEAVRRKMFEPFFTTKPVGKGLGLGLSISAMIVHNHNGTISVRSQLGKGSVFRIELPL